jgi:D-alanyl-D-alanine carboxypeptidase
MHGTSAFLNSNNRISIYDCLCALMIPSGNDAAVVLATEFGRWLFLVCEKYKDSFMPFL